MKRRNVLITAVPVATATLFLPGLPGAVGRSSAAANLVSRARAAALPAVPAAPAPRPPDVRARSAYLLDVQRGVPLFQKFPAMRLPPASTTKIMTGLLIAESGRLQETATVSRRAAVIGETTMGLAEGERLSMGELLYGLMLNSGNDAAVALAEHFSGSVAAFADRMNARAAELGLTDTHLVNPHGLDHASYYSPEHFSSARDLATLAALAMRNPTFAGVVRTTRREVAGPPGKPPHRLRNLLSALWWYAGVSGVKTGWTERAGDVRVVVAERSGVTLVAVVMRSPDHVAEIRNLLDYGFAVSGQPQAQTSVPLSAEGFPAPEARLTQAWVTYKSLTLEPDGRVRRGDGGVQATSDAQAAALLHAVWFRDRAAFDAIWSWTRASLSRRQADPAVSRRDALFASRWARGSVTDWSNSTAADQRIAAALLLASRLWNEPTYASGAQPILTTLLNDAAISWNGLGIAAANTFLKELEPVTTSADTLTPAFYRMFAEGGRNSVWLWLLDGTYATLDRAAGGTGTAGGAGAAGAAGGAGAAGAAGGAGAAGAAAGSPLGGTAGVLPEWFSVSRDEGTVGDPVDPTWQTTGFGERAGALTWQLALDEAWSSDPRARALLAGPARFLARDLAQRRAIAPAYSRAGLPISSAETQRYGALAGIVRVEPGAEPALRAKLDAALASRDPDRLLDAIDGLWLLAGGPPNYWRIWTPPADLPTSRNDGVVPPTDGSPWRYFEETGHVVRGRFLEYVLAHGGPGLPVFGFPRTEEMLEDGRTVQYFQRGRLEYYPERAGTPGELVLTPLGRQAATARDILTRPEARRVAPFETDDIHAYIPESGHSLTGGFRSFYDQYGGAAVLGLPLTEEMQEDGFTVQYFERAVLEYVPGKTVQASLLGDDLLKTRGWLK